MSSVNRPRRTRRKRIPFPDRDLIAENIPKKHRDPIVLIDVIPNSNTEQRHTESPGSSSRHKKTHRPSKKARKIQGDGCCVSYRDSQDSEFLPSSDDSGSTNSDSDRDKGSVGLKRKRVYKKRRVSHRSVSLSSSIQNNAADANFNEADYDTVSSGHVHPSSSSGVVVLQQTTAFALSEYNDEMSPDSDCQITFPESVVEQQTDVQPNTVPDRPSCFNCTVCEFSFNNIGDFRRHIHANHLVTENADGSLLITGNKPPPGELQCIYCGEVCASATTLHTHQYRTCKKIFDRCKFCYTSILNMEIHLKKCIIRMKSSMNTSQNEDIHEDQTELQDFIPRRGQYNYSNQPKTVRRETLQNEEVYDFKFPNQQTSSTPVNSDSTVINNSNANQRMENFSCDICSSIFSCPIERRKHIFTKHNFKISSNKSGKKVVSVYGSKMTANAKDCPYCGKSFKNRINQSYHQHVSNCPLVYSSVCDFCDKVIGWNAATHLCSVVRYIFEYQDPLKDRTCFKCGQIYDALIYRQVHLKRCKATHPGPIFWCSTCQRYLLKTESLDLHRKDCAGPLDLISDRSDISSYKENNHNVNSDPEHCFCSICLIQFGSFVDHRKHILSTHNVTEHVTDSGVQIESISGFKQQSSESRCRYCNKRIPMNMQKLRDESTCSKTRVRCKLCKKYCTDLSVHRKICTSLSTTNNQQSNLKWK